MKLVLLGAPGAGKGTQAVKIAEKYSIPHISTGDIFRKNIKEQTKLGQLAKSFIDKGELVPDSVVCDIVKDRLTESDCKNGFLLDGFPRTLYQAESLKEFIDLDAVVELDIDLNLLLKRLTGRRVCPSCGESFHVDFLNGSDTCSKCGDKLIIRADDTEETVASRLDVYVKQTAPLVEFYSNLGILLKVDGFGAIDTVTNRVFDALDGLKK